MNSELMLMGMAYDKDAKPNWVKDFHRAVKDHKAVRAVGSGVQLRRATAAAEALVCAACWMQEHAAIAQIPVESITCERMSHAFWAASARELFDNVWPKGFRNSLRDAMHQAREYLYAGVILENWRQDGKKNKLWTSLAALYTQLEHDAESRSWFDTRDVRFSNFYDNGRSQPMRNQLGRLAKRVNLARAVVMARNAECATPEELQAMPVETVQALATAMQERLLAWDAPSYHQAGRNVALKAIKEGLALPVLAA